MLTATNGSTDRLRAMLVTALGPIGGLLEDPRLTDILANPDGRVWIERIGEPMVVLDDVFTVEQRLRVLRLLASNSDQECHAERPSLSTILPTGERFQGYVPPVVIAPAFAIRKPAATIYSLNDYVRDGICTVAHAHAIRLAIRRQQNLVIAGGTRTGKTTLANAVLAEMAELGERIITIEDIPELQCTAPNHLAKYTVVGKKSLQDAVKETLRDRPDRIIVGEVRGPEVEDVLDAWSTGHPGGLCTVHAGSADGTLRRLTNLLRRAGMPQEVARELVGEAEPVIVYIERTPAGRRLAELVAVRGYINGVYVKEQLG